MTPADDQLEKFLAAMRAKCDVADRLGDCPEAREILADVDGRTRAFASDVPLDALKLLFPEVRFV
tara:strand:+ start:3205 stop:3399 length:195 start_codon:yes stop_codon:yes gene_type:complete